MSQKYPFILLIDSCAFYGPFILARITVIF